MNPLETVSIVLNALEVMSGLMWTVRHLIKRWLRHREADIATLDQMAEQAVAQIADYVREEEEKFHHDADSIEHVNAKQEVKEPVS
jgi:hypothetical protein